MPRMRCGCWRSIPACAGEPIFPRAVIALHRVYPRVCGGTGLWFLLRTFFSGLSPRVRGNRKEGWTPDNIDGSIPACAGEPVNYPR